MLFQSAAILRCDAEIAMFRPGQCGTHEKTSNRVIYMRNQVRALVTSRNWEVCIIGVIVLNAVTLGLETSPAVMAEVGSYLRLVDQVILGIFVVELALRLYAHGLKFFKDPWSLFDFSIVAISLMPATGNLSVLRSLRILRALRLISVVPSLRRVIGGLVAALPGMGSIVVLMALVFYVFAVMATKLYGEAFPEWFGNLGASLYTLFQVMTLESWSMGHRASGHGCLSLFLAVLCPLHPVHGLHGAEPLYRYHRLRHAGGTRG